MQHEDQKYIIGLVENDTQVIDEIYSRFSMKIKNYILYNSGSIEEAKDVFQEGLISIYNKSVGGNFVLTCPFEAYLYMVCRSKWLNILKSAKKKKETKVHDSVYINTEASNLSEETILYELRMSLLEKKLSEISKRCRELLKASWSGLSMTKVSEQLGISYSYARKKKSECKATLMEKIRNDENFNSYLPE